jgi:hypothetical protein
MVDGLCTAPGGIAVTARRPQHLRQSNGEEVTMKAHCTCAAPIPVERAERKGAAHTECARCGKPVAPRLAPPRAA